MSCERLSPVQLTALRAEIIGWPVLATLPVRTRVLVAAELAEKIKYVIERAGP